MTITKRKRAILVSSAAAIAVTGLTIGRLWLRRRVKERERRTKYPYRAPLAVPLGQKFKLDLISEEQCYEFFRFTKDEIKLLIQLLPLSDIKYSRYRPSPEEALALHSRSWQSHVFNITIEFLAEVYAPKLYWDFKRLTIPTLQRYAQAIEEEGGIRGVWGFIDGTFYGNFWDILEI
ncbi:hypothetical protein BDZ91DRAFT_853671 [Kalaharituber pfeilii]|nr:hypothetical protein BDZ91DRAFT_853671 [Kalaharituber pfeilii]